MRIEQSPSFRRDFKKLKKKNYDMRKLKLAVEAVASADVEKLSTKYKNHSLKGNWRGYRELHIEGDWLLIYKVDNEKIVLALTRMGSHDDLF